MFITLIISLCFLILNVQGAVLPESRVIGGDVVTIYDHPYQVALLHLNPSSVFALACGGALLRLDAVLTAAQCTTGTTGNQWRVRAGSSYHAGESGELAIVDRYVQHASFVGYPSMENDISLMFLTTELLLSDTIKLVALPYQGDILADGTLANFTGWGASSLGGPSQDVIQRIQISVVAQDRCVNAYSGFVAITTNMLCAGVIGVGGKDFCNRDTGGPLVVDNKVYGVASFSYSCGDPNYPGVYTKVSNYFNWINSNVV